MMVLCGARNAQSIKFIILPKLMYRLVLKLDSTSTITLKVAFLLQTLGGALYFESPLFCSSRDGMCPSHCFPATAGTHLLYTPGWREASRGEMACPRPQHTASSQSPYGRKLKTETTRPHASSSHITPQVVKTDC